MYRDKTLIPTEAIRLCALGMLAAGKCKYGDLASGVRDFSSHIVGPSLDILGPSIELLRYEGLAEAVEKAEAPEDTVLAITEAGQAELLELLRSNVRAPMDDINKLVVALKFRFLHHLEPGERRDQIDGLVRLCMNEHDRLSELRDQPTDQPTDEGGGLSAWLDHDLGQLEARIAWLEEYRNNL
jgi:DNA-binding PadR family transcriptional regulator